MTDLFTNGRFRKAFVRHIEVSAAVLISFLSILYALSLRDGYYLQSGLHAIFRNDQSVGNTAIISRRLADMESIGLLSCLRLESETVGEFYDTGFKPGCTVRLLPFEVEVSGALTAISGQKINYKFITKRSAGYFIVVAVSLATLLLLGNTLVYILRFRRSVKEREEELQRRLVEIAEQASHDIRSPVSALKMALRNLEGLAEDKREIIQKASERINIIANELLSKSRGCSSQEPTESPLPSGLIVTYLRELFNEKN